MTAELTQGERTLATLNDDGAWESKVGGLAEILNNVFSPKRFPPSTAAGVSPYADQARAAATALRAEIHWPKTEGVADDGVIH